MKKNLPLCESQPLGYAKDLGNGRAIYSKWPEKKKFIYKLWQKSDKKYVSIWSDYDDFDPKSEWNKKNSCIRDLKRVSKDWKNFYEIHKFQVTEQRIK